MSQPPIINIQGSYSNKNNLIVHVIIYYKVISYSMVSNLCINQPHRDSPAVLQWLFRNRSESIF